MHTLLSGIQPSGHLMIGHLFGAIAPWKQHQHDYNCLFPLVDLHAITVRQDPTQLRENTYEILALYLAAGLDPNTSTFFAQSHVPQHTQLSWALNCFTYMGELNRMTQFKDKSQRHENNINTGLFSYPTLMAADILLYQTHLVPVGEDQTQHLELCRNLAERLNNAYPSGSPLFTLPQPLITSKQKGGRIMALQDPTRKMSKSDTNHENTLFLLDPPKTLSKKIKRAITDSGADIRYDPVNKPGVANLLTLYSLITERSIDDLCADYSSKGYGHLKSDLADATVAYLEPLQQHYHQIAADRNYLDTILKKGAHHAQSLAQPTISRVYDAIGFPVPR